MTMVVPNTAVSQKSKMRLTMAAILLVSAILCSAEQAQQYPRPRRPERFDSSNQVSNYLKELQEYYSVHGRGRFGKRQMHIADATVTFREETPFFNHPFNEKALFKSLGFK